MQLPPPPADAEGGEVDMDIEEGELPGQKQRQQQQQMQQGYPGYPAPAGGDYYQQQQAGWEQQGGWSQQQQGYGQAAYGQVRVSAVWWWCWEVGGWQGREGLVKQRTRCVRKGIGDVLLGQPEGCRWHALS